MEQEPPPNLLNNNKSVVTISEEDVEAFEHQVSGHGFKEKGLLRTKSFPNKILKPLQPPPMGDRELLFYKRVQQSTPHSCYFKLSPFIPMFHGLAQISNRDHLILDDIVTGITNPSIIDLKLGAITWSPDASEKKIKQEMSKYVGTKQSLGLSLCGMQYYDDSLNRVRLSKDDCKRLDALMLNDWMRLFFNKSSNHSILREVLESLRVILGVFEEQREFKVFGSSLLVAFGSSSVSSGSGDTNNQVVRVRMIDFAHFHENNHESEGDQGLDENYLFGIRNFVKILDLLLEEEDGK